MQASETTTGIQTQMQASLHSNDINTEDLTQAAVPTIDVPSKEAVSASSNSTNRKFIEDDRSYSVWLTGNCVKDNGSSVNVLGSTWNKSTDKL